MSSVALPPDSFTPHMKGPPRTLVTAVWVFIAVAVIAMTGLGQSIKTGKVDWVDRAIWELGWICWAPLTYLVLAICRRFPIEREKKLLSILRLALFGVGVVTLQMALDFLCNSSLGWWLKGTPPNKEFLFYIFVFKGHIYYGVYWMIVGAAHAYEFHARYVESQLTSSQLEAKLAQAELSLLKGQLQPHFLFNTHNSIVSLMLKQDNAGAIRMLTRLSDLLRISLTRSQQQLVTLHEELVALRLYLEIQHERFRERLTIEIDVPSELENAQLPHLILQPLVENALTHGLGDVTENGRLAVCARRDGGTLELVVKDNGAGFATSTSHVRRADANSGVGLTNTQERLQQLYGPSHSFQITSAPGKGCVVTLRIPFQENPPVRTDAP